MHMRRTAEWTHDRESCQLGRMSLRRFARRSAVLGPLLALLACTIRDPFEDASASATTTTSTGETTAATTPDTTSTTSTGTTTEAPTTSAASTAETLTSATSTGDAPTSTTGDDLTGTSDPGTTTTDGTTGGPSPLGSLQPCGLNQPACPPGEKCSLKLGDMGFADAEPVCVTVTGDGAPGVACETDYPAHDGGFVTLDDCDANTYCWGADWDPGQCLVLCPGGDADCPQGQVCLLEIDAFPLCHWTCDPQVPDDCDKHGLGWCRESQSEPGQFLCDELPKP